MHTYRAGGKVRQTSRLKLKAVSFDFSLYINFLSKIQILKKNLKVKKLSFLKTI